MSSSSDAFQAVMTTIVSYLAILLSNVVTAVRYFYANYPETARILSILVAGYFVFKSFMRILRFWWGMLKFVAKVVLLFVVCVVALLAYYRGPHRFFTKDIPFIYRFWKSISQKQRETLQNSLPYADILGKSGIDPVAVKNSAAGWVSENAEQIDTIKNGAKHLASENIDHIQNFVKNNVLSSLLNLGVGNNPRA